MPLLVSIAVSTRHYCHQLTKPNTHAQTPCRRGNTRWRRQPPKTLRSSWQHTRSAAAAAVSTLLPAAAADQGRVGPPTGRLPPIQRAPVLFAEAPHAAGRDCNPFRHHLMHVGEVGYQANMMGPGDWSSFWTGGARRRRDSSCPDFRPLFGAYCMCSFPPRICPLYFKSSRPC